MTLGKLRRSLRQAMTVARRDFMATVFAPTFLIFLLSPLLTIGFGAAGGFGASTMAQSAIERSRLVVLTAPGESAPITTADQQLRGMFGREDAPPPIEFRTPDANPGAQARALIGSREGNVDAVLYGPLAKPHILYGNHADNEANYLATIAEQVVRTQRIGSSAPLSVPIKTRIAQTQVTVTGHTTAAMFAVMAIFLLTLFLSGLTIGTMAEERNNKVIEVLAAAVPLESVFLGKLIGMFGVALLFVGFWGTVASQITSLLPPGMAAGLAQVAPAAGKLMFALLFLIYFVMSYLLFGAAYLILGAQASTQRELQMMSLPMTLVQMGMVGMSTAAAASPGSPVAWIAAIFPFSSPMAMAAQAANSPSLWPHLIAILWQLLWVSVVISLGASWFRRGVLKSGGGPKRRRSQPATA
ncbi:ABC transporter permease [Sphingomonas sp.]|jgi:ABC-2 type transport system permease protein|uniref:ABC transporter permease n=1 Tax=Sphingomonas sp. TaxID=28214 RepID=UPI002E3379F6|nr:ABC transporter permease [Sphingomonas sp.]HEX4693252.1 ABC transporter permease [Sphingomonas sp.]